MTYVRNISEEQQAGMAIGQKTDTCAPFDNPWLGKSSGLGPWQIFTTK